MTSTATRNQELPDSSGTSRLMAAGRVILVVTLGLLGGLFLNANDILRTAERQEAGWHRTVGVAVMEPVAWLSHALFIDRPRMALDAIVGREPVDTVEEPAGGTIEEPGSTSTTTPGVTTTAPALRREVTADEPLRLFVGGDSMVGQFGPMLEIRAEEAGLVETTQVLYEFESGITRSDFIDWPARLRTITAEQDPEVVVLVFGGNDAQAIQIDGEWVDFGNSEWEEEYRSRVSDLMRQITSEGRDLYWVGMPIVSSDTFRPRVELMNEVYRSEAAKIDGVTFFDSWRLFEGLDGGYAEYLPNAEGDVVDMRLNDGVHLTTNGGIRLARAVWDEIAANWKLPPG